MADAAGASPGAPDAPTRPDPVAQPGPLAQLEQVARLEQVMRRLRHDCSWDAEQTHRSLVTYLVEETGEVVDAIEQGTPADLREELGDLLLQVVFHCEIEREQGGFSLDDVAGDIADKLVRRHPHVFADADVPGDLDTSWEQRKRDEKQRTSALDGIPTSLDPLARAQKVVSRARRHGVPVRTPATDGGPRPVTADDATGAGASAGDGVEARRLGHEVLALVARADALGIDAAQATRDALRVLEQQVRADEADADHP